MLGCFLFAPVELGGSTLYSATVGNSMEPRFHKGDLAVMRVGSPYRVGDVVLYESPLLGRPVLHRIIVIQNRRYFFKGDHNGFVDPGSVTRSALLGKLWFRIPRAGRALDWVGAPSHAALLSGAVVLFLLLGSGGKAVRRRRRGRRRTTGSRQPVTPLSGRSFHRHRTIENIAGGGGLLLALIVLAVGFGTSLKRPVRVDAYTQRGAFSYKAKVVHPPYSAYPSGLARTGDPLFMSAFRLVRVSFSYRFNSPLAHSVHGTIGLVAVLSSDSTLHNRYVLQKPRAFHGDAARIGGTFDLQKLQSLMEQLSIESGSVDAGYSIDLQPVVRIAGVVGGNNVSSIFSPFLPFAATQTALQLNVPEDTELPGASYTLPSGRSSLTAALDPAQPGRIPGVAPNHVSLARYQVTISVVRGVGIGLLGLALIILLSKLFKAPPEIWSHEKRTASRYGCVVVDVLSVGDHPSPDREATEVPDFESLARLAHYCERPILREGTTGAYVYAVEDDGRLYVHRPHTGASAGAPRTPVAVVAPPAPVPVVAARVPVPAAVTAIRRPSAARKRHPLLVRALGALFTLALATTLVTSFTATNLVPLSHAGTVSPALSVALGAPAQCAALGVTNLVIATSATVTGTAADDLILGEKGTGKRTLNGGAGNDCIVGGGQAGTTNNFNGGTGSDDVCLGAPGATNHFTNCDVTVN